MLTPVSFQSLCPDIIIFYLILHETMNLQDLFFPLFFFCSGYNQHVEQLNAELQTFRLLAAVSAACL